MSAYVIECECGGAALRVSDFAVWDESCFD